MGVYDTFKDGVKTHFEHACEIHMCEDSTCFRIELCCQNYETVNYPDLDSNESEVGACRNASSVDKPQFSYAELR